MLLMNWCYFLPGRTLAFNFINGGDAIHRASKHMQAGDRNMYSDCCAVIHATQFFGCRICRVTRDYRKVLIGPGLANTSKFYTLRSHFGSHKPDLFSLMRELSTQ